MSKIHQLTITLFLCALALFSATSIIGRIHHDTCIIVVKDGNMITELSGKVQSRDHHYEIAFKYNTTEDKEMMMISDIRPSRVVVLKEELASGKVWARFVGKKIDKNAWATIVVSISNN